VRRAVGAGPALLPSHGIHDQQGFWRRMGKTISLVLIDDRRARFGNRCNPLSASSLRIPRKQSFDAIRQNPASFC
jgi:hypothetical protein